MQAQATRVSVIGLGSPSARQLCCECGVALEADTDQELYEVLFEHLAVSHDAPLRADPRQVVGAIPIER
jgi:hypothetical protein